MRALTLRRAGFVATLAAGLALTASGVHGVSTMDTTLELAAAPAERPALAAHHERDWCDGVRDERRLV